MKAANFLRIVAVAAALSGYAAWALGEKEAAAPAEGIALPAGTLPLVRLAETRRLWQDPQAIFLDVRTAADFEAGHIPGAVLVPWEEFEERLPALKPRLERAKFIVVYCKSTDCGKSLWAAIRLHNEGLTRTHIYPGGWNEWFVNGLPAERADP